MRGSPISRLRTAAIDILRRFFGQRWLLPMTALLLRARTVRPSAPFVLRELFRCDGIRLYRLADSELRVAIRHRTGDVVTLGEVFHDHDYVPDRDAGMAFDGIREIVDLGANIGLFGAFAAARWPQARITGFEPDPSSAAVHERTISANNLGHRWAVLQAAAGSRDGETHFLAGQAALSRMVDSEDSGTIVVPVRDVLPLISGADLVKIDIEGGEWPIICDPRFRDSPPRAVVLEYHPYLCPAADPRAAAEEALRAANMRIQAIKHHPDGYGMLWGWRI